MAQYIPKSALVAEIEKLKGQLLRGACSSQIYMQTRCKEESYDEVLSFIDTLEVKEMDLEEAAKKAATQFVGGEEKFFWNDYHKFKACAKWQKQQTIDKAAEWMASNVRCDGYTLQTKAKLIRDFKKYMED